MSDDLTFQSVSRRGPGRRSSCAVCGQATAGGVQITLNSKKGSKPKMVTSRGKALCERHAVELYRRLEADFVQFIEGGSP